MREVKKKLSIFVLSLLLIPLSSCSEGGSNGKGAESAAAQAYLAGQQPVSSIPQLADLENQFPNYGILFTGRLSTWRNQQIQLPILDPVYFQMAYPGIQVAGPLLRAYIDRVDWILNSSNLDDISYYTTQVKRNQIEGLLQLDY